MPDELKGSDADLEFHLAIADASHNIALIHVMRGLMNLFRTSTTRFRMQIFDMHDGSSKLLQDQHRAIHDAVVSGDPEAARDAAHLHLSFIEASLRESDHSKVVTPPRSGRPKVASLNNKRKSHK